MIDNTISPEKPYYIRQNDCMSVFPPCVFCGAQYEAHETIDQFDGRGHTINHPDMPQHGQFHYFTPLPPERFLKESQVEKATLRASE